MKKSPKMSWRTGLFLFAGAVAVFTGSAASVQAESSLENAADMAQGKRVLAAAPAYGDRGMGKPGASVMVIEYGSASCPHCAEFDLTLLPAIKRDFIDTGKVIYIFREFPLDERSLGAFMLARCAAPEAYFATLTDIFRDQALWTKGDAKAELYKIVARHGVTTEQADKCTTNGPTARAMYASAKRATSEFNVRETPTFFVNGKKIDGHQDLMAVRIAIRDAVKATAPAPKAPAPKAP